MTRSNDNGAWFEPYVARDTIGRVTFANRLISHGYFPRVRRRSLVKRIQWSRSGVVAVRGIELASRVAEARRWIPLNPLLAHLMRAEDAKKESIRKYGTARTRNCQETALPLDRRMFRRAAHTS